jgi:single-strand DNA-binding protein
MTLNRVMVIGNVTRDPETRTSAAGSSVCTFGVATNRIWTNQQTGERQEEAEFHNVVAFGRLAEICAQYLGRGRKVYVEGRMKTREWQAQDGTRRNRTEIVCENMIMLDRAPGGATQYNQSQPNSSPTVEEKSIPVEDPVSPVAPAPKKMADEIQVEEIPF